MLKEITKLLIKKWEQEKLAHFYIVRPANNLVEEKSQVNQWADSFLQKIISQEWKRKNKTGLTTLQAQEKYQKGIPDILTISLDKDKKGYTLDDFAPFFKFLNFKNIEYKQRFILVKDANFIESKNLSNKLLKSLEEPTPNTTIIFTSSNLQNFIPTIESRAISLRFAQDLIPENKKVNIDSSDIEYFKDWLSNSLKSKGPDNLDEESKNNLMVLKNNIISVSQKKITLNEFINYLNANANIEYLFIEIVSSWLSQNKSFKVKKALLNDTKWHITSKKFHNPSYERLIPFIQQLQSSIQ